MIDPRDEREVGRFFQVVGTDEGVFGCMGLMACEDLCPKGIPLQSQLAYVRRKLAMAALGKKI
jgi:fumarate reductase iron-sulfur subunit